MSISAFQLSISAIWLGISACWIYKLEYESWCKILWMKKWKIVAQKSVTSEIAKLFPKFLIHCLLVYSCNCWRLQFVPITTWNGCRGVIIILELNEYINNVFYGRVYIVLPPFQNVSHSSISHIHVDDIFRFININMNMRNARINYIVKRREYILTTEQYYREWN
mgnify:CR=1 FL=1